MKTYGAPNPPPPPPPPAPRWELVEKGGRVEVRPRRRWFRRRKGKR